MNVLIACEESQEVCKAFRAKGHTAYSCDIQECSGGHPEWHIQGDVLPLLNGNCTFETADTHTHIARKMGSDHSASTLHIYQQRRGSFFISGWQRDSERRKIKKGHRSNAFLLTFPICGLRQDCHREPDTVNGLLFAKVYPNNSTLDVWASGTEKNVFMVERLAGVDSNRNMLRTAIKQGSGQLVQQRWQRATEKQGKDISWHCKSNG